MTILLIDDDGLTCRVFARLLGRRWGVQTVASARAALRMIDAGRSFDAIVCDLSMPEMSGRELYDRLLGRDPELASRLIIFSGLAADDADPFARTLQERYVLKTDAAALVRAIEARVPRSKKVA